MRTREELAWAAGFFEGEGTMRITLGKPGVMIGNTDRSTLEAFVAAVGLGKIGGPYYPKGCTKPFYQLWISDFEGMQALCAMLWHLLSIRRRAQFVALMDVCRQRRSKLAA